VKKSKRTTPTVIIENCNLTGGTSPGIEALARAIEANSNAILALSQSIQRPNSLIYVGAEKDGAP